MEEGTEKEEEVSKIKAIIKRPDEEFGHIANISNTLENLQKIIGGKIEAVYLRYGLILIVNEEGKLMNLEPNFRTGRGFFADTIVGTAILVGQNGEDFGDVPITFQTWKSLLKEWGN